MRNRILILAMSCFMLVGLITGRQTGSQKDFDDYGEMRQAIGELFQQKNYEAAEDILVRHLEKFPENIKANTYNLAMMRVFLGKHEQAAEALKLGLEKGIWYGKYDFFAPAWNPLKKNPAFDEFLGYNQKMQAEAQKNAKPLIEVVEPKEYDPGKKYPLFIALHGGGENIAEFKPQWTSPKMSREFIVAYLQSSQVITMTGFNWTEDVEISKKEIESAYQKISGRYSLTGEVIIGGFSSGGVASLEIVLGEVFPVNGFIVLCPAKPDGFTADRIKAVRERGVRGTLLTTEMDQRIENQKEMARIMEEEGLPCEFIITPNVGHWYPEDIQQMIDSAIDFIRNK